MSTKPETFEAATSEAQPAGDAARRPRIRIPGKRGRLLRAVNVFAAAFDTHFDKPTLERLLTVNDDEFTALRMQLFDGVTAILHSIAVKPAVPDIPGQMETFALWQGQRSACYQWPAGAMEALQNKLIELGPGVELIPIFAMSVLVKLPSGKLILIDRDGKETKG